MDINPDVMRDTMRLWASGVTVVTTTQGGRYYGMTVSSFSSLCLTPPLVVACLFKDTTVANIVPESGVFAVSILHADQADLSERFAGRTNLTAHEDRFDGVPVYEAVTGSPIIQDATAWVDCKVFAIHEGGTHWIVVGEVLAADHRHDDTAPLLYFDRDYRTVEREAERRP